MYKRFYNLSTNPFRLAPEPSFCFSHTGYKRAREYLEYALDQGEGFVMVTGRPGTGKTMLVETFLKETSISRVVARRIAVSNYGADDLLRAVAFAYEIEAAGLDKATMRHRIQQYFAAQEQAGRRVLLIIDEAQALQHTALEELRILADLQTPSRRMLQLFLVGQESLQDLMSTPDMEQFQQRVIANYHLVPLNLMDTRAYIEYRLRQAGWHGDPEFSGAAVLSIYQLSKGVPRHINKICNRLLLLGFGKGSHRFDREDMQDISAEMREEQLTPLETHAAALTDPEDVSSIPEIRDGRLSIADLAIRADRPDAGASTISEVARRAAQHQEAFIAPDNEDRTGGYQQHASATSQLSDPVAVTTGQLNRSSAPASVIHPHPGAAADQGPGRRKWKVTLVASAAILAITTIMIAALPTILDKVDVKHALSMTDHLIREIQNMPATGASGLSDKAPVAATPAQAGYADDESVADSLPHEPQAINNNRLLTAEEIKNERYYQAAIGEINRQPSPDEEQPPVTTGSEDTAAATEAVEQVGSTQDETIERLLAQGQQSLDEYRLMTPEGDNAYGYFSAALRLDPANETARASIQKIVDLYITLAGMAVDRNENDRAARYLERGLSIQPDNPQLLALQDSVDRIRESAPASQAAVETMEHLTGETVTARSKAFLNKRQAEGRRREVIFTAGRDG